MPRSNLVSAGQHVDSACLRPTDDKKNAPTDVENTLYIRQAFDLAESKSTRVLHPASLLSVQLDKRHSCRPWWFAD